MDKSDVLAHTPGMRFFVFVLACLILISGCDLRPGKAPIASVQESGELVVLTRYSPTTYYEDAEGLLAGLEHDLAILFAKELGVKVRFEVVDRFSDLLPALREGRGHLAAAGLTMTPERQMHFRFSSPYYSAAQQVVVDAYRGKMPKTVADLIGLRIRVVKGSSFAEQLAVEKRRFPQLTWQESVDEDTEELLDRLAKGELDAVVAYADTLAVARNFQPSLATAFNLTDKQSYAWAFLKEGDNFLLEKSRDFFTRIERDGTLKRLLDRYYGHIHRLDRVDVERFLADMHTTLPKFKKLFQEAQELTGLDWRLLAVLGYQESHWDPLATSPTGVRGLMMLTNDTADRLGVSNRLDARQSILAGSRYLAYLKDQMPDPLQDPDRTWFALATYNIGYGHLDDARKLAVKKKLNPNAWTDLKSTLPLLAKAEFRSQVKHGYARGGETVIFVETIRTYFDILSRFEKPHVYEHAGPAVKIVIPKGKPRDSGTGLKLPANALLPSGNEDDAREEE